MSIRSRLCAPTIGLGLLLVSLCASSVPITDLVGGGTHEGGLNSQEQDRFAPALNALKSGDYRKALGLSRGYVGSEPGNLHAHFLLCISLIGNNSYKDFKTHIRELKQLNPALSDGVLNRLIDYFTRTGNVSRAFNLHDFISNPEKLGAEFLLRKAQIDAALGLDDEAIGLLKPLAVDKATSAKATVELTRIALKQGDFNKASEYSATLAETAPETDSKSLQVAATALLAGGQSKKAKAAFEKIIKHNESDIPATLGLGIVLLGDEDYSDAIVFFDRVLKQAPAVKEALLGKALAGWKLGHDKDAAAALEKLSAGDNDPLNFLFVALADSKAGAPVAKINANLQRAAGLFLDLKREQAISTEELLLLVEQNYYFRVGAWQYVIDASDAGSAARNAYVQLTLARSLNKLGRQPQAIEIYNSVQVAHPSMVAPIMELADIAYEKGDHEKAIAGYLKASKLSEGDRDIEVRLANLYNATKHEDDAVALYEALLKRYPADPYLLNQLAATLAEKRADAKKAVALLAPLVQGTPASPAILDTYAYALFQVGDLPSARKYYDLLYKNMGGAANLPAQSLFRMAETYRASGKEGEAFLLYEASLNKGQDFSEHQLAVDQVRKFWRS